MHRLGFLRVPFGCGASGIRHKPAPASARITPSFVWESTSTADRSQGLDVPSSGGSGNSSTRYLSTASAKKYEDIPKRIYQSAPKRSHGKHAGMKRWSPSGKNGKSAALSPIAPADEEQNGDMRLAFGKVGKAEGLREVRSGLKEIRVSPWSLNLVAKLVRGLPVVEASAQLQFCKKKHTVTVNKAIQNALNLADMRYGLAAEELEVGEIFVTKGKVVKRMRIMGRGRAGISRRKWSHLNVTLREIDYDKQIEEAPTRYRRQKLEARKDKVDELRAERGERVYAEPV